MLAKVVYAGSNNTSYLQAEADLEQLAELDVSDKQVRRLCQRLGDQRVDERDSAVAAYQALPLVERKSVPAGVVPPAVATISVDGGRVQIFERPPGATAAPPQAAAREAPPQPDVVTAATVTSPVALAPPGPDPVLSAADDVPSSAAATAVATAGAEEDDDERRGRFWREDKIGLLLTMESQESAQDPCPQIPGTFLHPARMSKLVR